MCFTQYWIWGIFSVNCVCGLQQLLQRGRRCCKVATRCRSRIALVSVDPLASSNRRQSPVQGNVELDVLIFHLVWLPFLPGEVARSRHPPSSRKEGEVQHLCAGQQWIVCLIVEHWGVEIWDIHLYPGFCNHKIITCSGQAEKYIFGWLFWGTCLVPAPASSVWRDNVGFTVQGQFQ